MAWVSGKALGPGLARVQLGRPGVWVPLIRSSLPGWWSLGGGGAGLAKKPPAPRRGWWKEGSVSRGKGGPSTMGMLLMGGVMRPDAGPPLGVLHEGHRSQDKGR